MKHLTVAILSFLFIFQNVHSQSIEELFSREGLSVNGYHYNFYDGTYSTSFTFVDKVTICDDLEVLRFFPHQGIGNALYLYIDDVKVYLVYSNCTQVLVYDFGVGINETITEGMYQGFTLIEKYPETLLNGEVRMRYDLENGFGGNASWIEGIGDVNHALIPAFYDFEGYDQFICAKEGNDLLWIDDEEGDLCDSLSCAQPIILVETETNDLDLNITNNTFFGSDYIWNFGDGNTSTEVIPAHLYDEPGCYELSVEVSNQCYEGDDHFLVNLPICIGDSWVTDYEFDTYGNLYVSRYSDELEFIYDRIGPNLQRTTDVGQTFTPIDLPQVDANVSRLISDIKMFDDQRGVMVCGHYGASSDQKAILVTTDGGITWEEKVTGSYFMLTIEVTADGKAWATGSSRRYYRSFDFGENWEQIEYPGVFAVRSIQYINDNLLVGRGYEGLAPWGQDYLIKSYDNGATWENFNFPPDLNSWFFFNENLAYAKRENGSFVISEDGGTSWNDLDLGFFVNSFAFFDPQHGWISDNTGLIHYTSDGMQSFSTTNCGVEVARGLTAISNTEAYMVSSLAHGASNVDDSRKHFDMDAMTIGCETTNISESEKVNIKVFPNPFRDQVSIELDSKNYTLQVRDLLGHSVLSQQSRGQSNVQLQLASLPQGIYLLNIRSQEGLIYTETIIKQ